MSWNVWWFGADPLTTSAFHSMGLKRPRHCLRHWNETGEPQNPQTLVRVTDMPCGFVYWPKFVNGSSLRPEAFPIVFFAAGLLPHPRSLKGVLFLHKSRAFEQQVEVCCEASSIPECKCQKHIRAKNMDQSTSIYIYISASCEGVARHEIAKWWEHGLCLLVGSSSTRLKARLVNTVASWDHKRSHAHIESIFTL